MIRSVLVRATRFQPATMPAIGRRFKATLVETQGLDPVKDRHVFEHQDQTALKESQAPNRKDTWAVSQRPRADAMTGPLFDGMDLSLQPQPYAAMDLIAQQPIKFVHHSAVCDGSIDQMHGGVQGHPKIYINVDKPGIHVCQYCGNRYADERYRAQIESGEITNLETS